MTRTLIGTFDLWDREAGDFVECELYDGVAAHNAGDFIDHWKPMFDAKRAELEQAGQWTADMAAQLGLEDSHWEWPVKALAATLDPVLHCFVIECAGRTQGLMIVFPAGLAREQSQRGLPITEVMLISTAPWNRPKLVPDPKYKGVGRLLITAAIELSRQEQCAGRICLHALSGAEDWYRACGMIDLGYDPGKNMHYFEMTEAQALRFISDGS